jgi:chromosome segregation ATPase
MEEDFKESQIIVSKLEASNAQYESRVAEYQNESKMTSKYAQDSKHEASNYSNQLRNAQGELDTTKVELGKANELLVRYQRDRQEIKRRMKSKADLIQKQEEILASVEFRSTELQERFVDKETECGCLGKELSMAKQHLSQARQQVEENQRTLASNQQVGCPREMFRWKFGESVTYIHICLICSFLLLNDFAPAFPHSRRLLLG